MAFDKSQNLGRLPKFLFVTVLWALRQYLEFLVKSKIEVYQNYSLRTDFIAYSKTQDLK